MRLTGLLKVIAGILIIFLIATESNAQAIIKEKRQLGYYFQYDGVRIPQKAVKYLIVRSGDQAAINMYRNYEMGIFVGIATTITGGTLMGVGLANYLEETGDSFSAADEQKVNRAKNLMIIGGGITALGIVGIILGNKSLDNSIERYNFLQFNSRIDLSTTDDGLGVVFKF